MGATNYITVSKGKDAKEAFSKARADAKWAHGNNGYTGTIAEKDSFVQFQRPAGTRQATIKHIVEGIAGPDEEIAKLAKKYPKFPIRKMLQVWDDKWGPSACMELKPKVYVFFGMASE